MTVDIGKVKRGDLVLLRRGQSGTAPGLYLVRELVDRGLAVVSLTDGQSPIAPLADVVWLGVNPLPSAEATLDPRPAARVEVVQSAEPPEALVTISVPNPTRKEYSFPTRVNPNPAVIVAEDSRHLNHNKISKKVIRVPASLVGIVLAGVDGSHLVGEAPDPRAAASLAREEEE